MDRNLTDMANVVFPAGPDGMALYPAAGQQRVLAALRDDVAAARHLLCLTGPAGSGKTVLLRALRKSFGPGLVHLIEQPVPGRLLRDLAKALQLDTEGANESSLRRRIVMLLSMTDRQRQPITQMVDDADCLPRDDLELLLHFFPRGHATLILAASADPDSWLAGCSTSAGTVTIERSYQLEPLTADETAAYVRHRLCLAGMPDDLLPPETLAVIHQKSGGLPGLINRFGADALAQTDSQDEAGDPCSVPEAAAETVLPEIFPQSASDELAVLEPAISSMPERRRRNTSTSRPVVAPSDACYQAQQFPARSTLRLRRRLRFYRIVAALAVMALALDLSRDVWRKHVPVDFALFENPIEQPVPEPAGSASSIEKPAGSKSVGSPATPMAPWSSPFPHSDFAALHSVPATGQAPRIAPSPDATRGPETAPSPSETGASATPESERPSAPDPPVDAAAPRVSKPSRSTRTDVGLDKPSKSGRREVGDAAAEPDDARKSAGMSRSQRREIARLYAERAEYEWRNGELGAAALSIQRGLATDPGNPRLREMRAMLWQLMREEP